VGWRLSLGDLAFLFNPQGLLIADLQWPPLHSNRARPQKEEILLRVRSIGETKRPLLPFVQRRRRGADDEQNEAFCLGHGCVTASLVGVERGAKESCSVA